MIFHIIVSYKSEKWLERCLSTLFIDEPSNVGCILIDNANMEPEFVRNLQSQYPSVRYISTGSNLNYGGGNNLGIEIALNEGAEYISLINPDTWFEPNWLSPLIQAFEQNPDFGILAPFQLQYHDNEPALWSVGNLLRGKSLPEVLNEPLIELPFTEGSCMVIRRSVFEKIGGFDPIYEMYYEEIDLCRRARRAGFRVGIIPSARYHHFGSSLDPDPVKQKKRNLQIDKSQWLSIITHPENTWMLNQANAFYWLLRRAHQWVMGQRPYFFDLLKFILQKYIYNYSGLYHKWKRDRLIS